MCDGGALRARVVEGGQDVGALGGGAAKQRVHEPGGGPRPAGRRARAPHAGLRQLDRLIDRGVLRRLREEELVEAEAKRGEGRVVDLAAAAPGEQPDHVIARRPPLDRAVGEPPSLGEIATAELGPRGRGGEGAVGPGTVLERPADHLVGHPPGDANVAHAASRGTRWPRRYAPASIALPPGGRTSTSRRDPSPHPSSSPSDAASSPGAGPRGSARARSTPSRSPPTSSRWAPMCGESARTTC